MKGKVLGWNINQHYICDNPDWDSEVFFDDGRIASMIIEEFNDLLGKYGLWYDVCFSWSLTTYRI